MYCKKCGKEIENNIMFCKYCGTMQEVQPANISSLQEQTEKSGEKKKIKPVKGAVVAVALAVVVIVAGVVIAFGSLGFISGNKCRENIESARKYLEQGKYSDALACCETAMELDEEYTEAYLMEADIFIAMDSYQDAIDVLERGMKSISSKESLNECEDKLEEVYQAEAECLVGVWKIDYNLADMIPKETAETLNSWGVDLNEIMRSLNVEVPFLLEVKESGILRISVDGKFFEGAEAGVSTLVKTIASLCATPVVGSIVGKITDILLDLLVNQVGISYTYEVRRGILYCIGQNEQENAYSFVINGNTLSIMGCLASDEETSYLSFPLTLERVE